MENVIIKFVADTDGLQPAIKQLEAIGKITAEDAARIQKLNDEQREYIQTVNQTTTAFGNLQSEAKDVAATINAQVLQGVADAMAEMGNEAQKGAGKFKSLKSELRELKAQIASGSLGAKEMREATMRAAELEDQIGDVSEKVRALASDTKYIDAAVTAMKGFAAAGAIAQGSMALLGSENEDLQKTMMKVQAATAVLMGVQEMAAIVTGQSAAKTLFLDAAQKVATVSSRVLGVTISASMAAATMGLSLVIGAIAALVVSMDDASDEAEAKAKEAQEKEAEIRKKNYENYIKGLISQGKAEDELILSRLKRKEKTMQNEIELETMAARLRIKALRESYLADEINMHEMVKRKKDIEAQLEYDIEQIRKRYAEKDKQTREKNQAERQQARQKEIDDEIKRLEVLNTLRREVSDRFIRDELAALQLQALNQNETNDQIAAMLADNYDKQIALRKQLLIANQDLTKNELELETAKLDEEAKVYRATLAAKVLAAKNANQEITTDTEEATKKQTDYVQQYADAATSILTTLLQTNKELTQRQLEAQLGAIQEERDTALRTIDLTEAQRLKIEERYRQQEKRIKEQAFKQQKQADIIQATINTALAVSRALASPPSPNVAAAVAAGIAGGAQIALIASQPLPRFAQGTEQFLTDGTGTSDSGLAWLSNGERVVPASINSEYWGALSAIQNRKISPRLANSVIEELSRGGGDAMTFDYDRLGRVIGGGKSSSKVVINLDERGFTKHVMRENSRVTYLNKKLRLTA